MERNSLIDISQLNIKSILIGCSSSIYMAKLIAASHLIRHDFELNTLSYQLPDDLII